MRPALPTPDPDPEFHPIAEVFGEIPPLPIVPLPPPPSLPHPLPTVDVHEVIGGVIREHAPRLRAKRLKVNLRLQARSYLVPGDPERLRQIVKSLVKTAADSVAPGGKITIRSSCPVECALRLEVEKTPSTSSGQGATAEPGRAHRHPTDPLMSPSEPATSRRGRR